MIVDAVRNDEYLLVRDVVGHKRLLAIHRRHPDVVRSVRRVSVEELEPRGRKRVVLPRYVRNHDGLIDHVRLAHDRRIRVAKGHVDVIGGYFCFAEGVLSVDLAEENGVGGEYLGALLALGRSDGRPLLGVAEEHAQVVALEHLEVEAPVDHRIAAIDEQLVRSRRMGTSSLACGRR